MGSLGPQDLRPAITVPRDLAMPGRLLRAALSRLDLINPFPSPPAELDFDAADRDGQVAGFYAWREATAERRNAERRRAWRAIYGGVEAVMPLRSFAEPEWRSRGPFELKASAGRQSTASASPTDAAAAKPAGKSANVHQLPRGKQGESGGRR